MGNHSSMTWSPTNIGTPYNVRLEWTYECCADIKELFINDVKVDHFSMSQRGSCSPYCGPDISYAWEDHGHKFVLQYNAYPCCSVKYFRLFVDGVDVETGLGFSKFFKQQGHCFLISALIFFLLLAGAICLVIFLDNGLSQLWIPINVGTWGIIFFVLGIVAVIKFRNKSIYENEPQATSWPEAYSRTTTSFNA